MTIENQYEKAARAIGPIQKLKSNWDGTISHNMIGINVSNKSDNAVMGVPLFDVFDKCPDPLVTIKEQYPGISYQKMLLSIQLKPMEPIGIMLHGSAVKMHSNIVPITCFHQDVFGKSYEAVYSFEAGEDQAQPSIILHKFTSEETAYMFKLGPLSRYEIIKMPAHSELFMSLYFK